LVGVVLGQKACETTNATTIPKLTSRNRSRAITQCEAVLGTSRMMVAATPASRPAPFSPINSGTTMHTSTATTYTSRCPCHTVAVPQPTSAPTAVPTSRSREATSVAALSDCITTTVVTQAQYPCANPNTLTSARQIPAATAVFTPCFQFTLSNSFLKAIPSPHPNHTSISSNSPEPPTHPHRIISA
jgi:hypothetical protein